MPAFVEHGLWLPTASAQRDCLSDTIAHCVGLEAATKQRQAQTLVSMIRRYICWRNRNAHDKKLREVVNRANAA